MGIAGDIINSIKLVKDGRTYNKENLSEFLNTVAQDAEILADLWTEILEQYEMGLKEIDLPKDFNSKLRKASFNQGGVFGELKIFYEYYLKENFFEKMNGQFVLSLLNILEYRTLARSDLDNMRNKFAITDWMDEKDKQDKIENLENLVENMHKEASRLRALAKMYKVSS